MKKPKPPPIPEHQKILVVGTKAVIAYGAHFRVICATCDKIGPRAHPTKQEAISSAVALSGSPCRTCRAR